MRPRAVEETVAKTAWAAGVLFRASLGQLQRLESFWLFVGLLGIVAHLNLACSD